MAGRNVNELANDMLLYCAQLQTSADLKMHVINLTHVAVDRDMQLVNTPTIFGLQLIGGVCDANTVDTLLVLLYNNKTMLRFVEIVGDVPESVLIAIRDQAHVTNLRFCKCTDNMTKLYIPPKTAILSFSECTMTELPDMDANDTCCIREFYVLDTTITSLSGLPEMCCLEYMVLRNNQLHAVPPWTGKQNGRYEIRDEKNMTTIPSSVFCGNSPAELVIAGCPECQFPPVCEFTNQNLGSILLSGFLGTHFPDIIGKLLLKSLTLIGCPNLAVLDTISIPVFTESLSTLRITGCDKLDPAILTGTHRYEDNLVNIIIVQAKPFNIITSIDELQLRE